MEKLLTDMVTKVASEPGALAYTVHRSTVDPTLFMIYEKYVDNRRLPFIRIRRTSRPRGLGEILDGAPDLQIWEELAVIKR